MPFCIYGTFLEGSVKYLFCLECTLLSHYHLHSFTQKLTTLTLQYNQMGDQGAQHLANAFHNNTVNHFLYSSISLPSALFHTDTHHTQPWMESNRRPRGRTSRQCFTQQHGEPLSLLIYLITICTFSQTLTTLNLECNQIEDQGAQHLANALHNNTVNHFLYSSFSLPSALFHTDTHDTQPSTQSDRRPRGTTSGQCFTQQHGKPLSLLIYLIIIRTFSHRHSPHSASRAIKSETK